MDPEICLSKECTIDSHRYFRLGRQQHRFTEHAASRFQTCDLFAELFAKNCDRFAIEQKIGFAINSTIKCRFYAINSCCVDGYDSSTFLPGEVIDHAVNSLFLPDDESIFLAVLFPKVNVVAEYVVLKQNQQRIAQLVLLSRWSWYNVLVSASF